VQKSQTICRAALALCFLFSLDGACLSQPAQQASPGPGALTVHPLKEGRVYWVEGGGGNSGIIIGDTGVIVVDAKTTPDAGTRLVAEVAKLTPKPITHVILTHSDGDHVNGLAGFPDGLKIVAHVNNKAEQLAVYQYAAVEIDGGKCLPPSSRLPNQVVFRDKVSTVIDGVPITLLHFGPAHTSGDLVVFLPRERVAFTGDLITSSVLVHPEKSGSFEGWFKNADGLLDLNATDYVGGHARQTDTKDTLRKRVDELQQTKAKIDALFAGGKSLAEAKAAMGDPAKDPSGCRGIPYLSLTAIEYNDQANRAEEVK
jgi:glyoxylase-like metal-dependent hydrolase (beta-lactamase superfamily II)